MVQLFKDCKFENYSCVRQQYINTYTCIYTSHGTECSMQRPHSLESYKITNFELITVCFRMGHSTPCGPFIYLSHRPLEYALSRRY